MKSRTALKDALHVLPQFSRDMKSTCMRRCELKTGKTREMTNIIRISYDGMTCRVVYTFEVRTGVRQGCLQPPVMFLLTMDGVMKTSTAQGRNGIKVDTLEAVG